MEKRMPRLLRFKERAYAHMSIVRVLAMIAVHLSLFAAAGCLAFVLRFEFKIPAGQVGHLLWALPIWLTVKSVAFHVFTVNRGAWRFVSLPDALALLSANAAGSLASALLIILFAPPGFPRSIYLSDFAFCLLLTVGIRVVVRVITEKSSTTKSGSIRAFIYGAGAAGVMLLRELQSNPALDYQVRGFIDDDPSKSGLSVHGVPVRCGGELLRRVAAKDGVQHVLIAIPSATSAQMIKILNYCADARLTFRTVPALSEVMRSSGAKVPIRELAVEDLLGRTPVRLEDMNVRAKLENQVILVTGAAGSIGSELCRQIARFGPKLILGFDTSETGLFYLDRELRQSLPGTCFQPAIGSIRNIARLDEIFDSYEVATVYHAAAYKHVPMMESHLFEAVENNIFGTYNLATSAGRFGVASFVMISSDKAVRPTGIMGLTKRVTELLVSSLENGQTRYVSVRFGNVLGSNGSVVAIFKQQIAAGGPLTITHPEMRRYFMTIPEAAQLVLQASTMGRGGEIFVLDMGEPVKIVDLAKNMILLSGRQPEDIAIVFTGIRPGEKLYEELCTAEEETRRTYHEKIRIFSGDGPRITNIEVWIAELRRMCAARDMRLIPALKELVADYNPSVQVLQAMVGPPKALVTPPRTIARPHPMHVTNSIAASSY
jgi:FlaA1/EpsC-like NDP-sugar epimerase